MVVVGLRGSIALRADSIHTVDHALTACSSSTLLRESRSSSSARTGDNRRVAAVQIMSLSRRRPAAAVTVIALGRAPGLVRLG